MEFVKLVGPFVIFFIMYLLGLKLNFINFYDLLRSPKNLIGGLICQLIFLPIIGLLIVSFYPMPTMGFIVSAQIFTDIAYVTPIALYALLQYFVLAFYIANIKIVN